MTNSVDPNQTAPIGAVCSGSALFASILNSSISQEKKSEKDAYLRRYRHFVKKRF